jgi:glycogenin glucosyltransferase
MKKVFVSLLTSSSYLPGILTLLFSIRQKSTLPVYCVTTVTENKTIDLLESLFDKVIRVDPITTRDMENLRLLKRLDLVQSLTKIHVFGIDADMAIYLDADTLVLSNIEDLFDILGNGEIFAAAPDQGWPDCFNSGVFCFRPSQSLFNSIFEFSKNNSSFDGNLLY